MRMPHRCNSCQSRFTLIKAHYEYQRVKKCPSCRSDNIRVDEYQRQYRISRKRNVCRCDGLPYPHRKASTPFCAHHPYGPTEEEEEYESRYGR